MAATADPTCAFCERPTTAAPWRPRYTTLTFRDPVTHALGRVRMPPTVLLCERCSSQRRLLAGCPRCRRYGRYRPYGQAPYGSSCSECGGQLWLLGEQELVR